MSIDDLRNKVSSILAQFQREELGNRLSNFSTAALRLFIDEAFEEYKKSLDKEIA